MIAISLEINGFFPHEFKYDFFYFHFHFGDEEVKQISYLQSNKITYKIPLNHKTSLCFQIKVTHNEFLVGICDFTIPYSIINKREKIYDKLCTISMTDSMKKFIFGNNPKNFLKINIHCEIQYLIETNSKNLIKAKTSSKDKIRSFNRFTPKRSVISKSRYLGEISSNHNNSKNMGTDRNLHVLNKSSSKINTKKLIGKNTKFYKSKSKSKTNTNILLSKYDLLRHNKNITSYNSDQNENNRKEITEIGSNNQNENSSVIDESVTNQDDDYNNIKEFISTSLNKEKDLEKIHEINDIEIMQEYSKNIILKFFDLQTKIFENFEKDNGDTQKLFETFLKYNEKNRYIQKKLGKLKEKINTNEIKNYLIENAIKKNYKTKDNILPTKNKELDFFSEIYGIHLNDKEIIEEKKKLNSNQEYINNKNQAKTLIKVLKNVTKKFGYLNTLLTPENSTDQERNNLHNILYRFGKIINDNTINQKNNDVGEMLNQEFEFVSAKKPDDGDKILNERLKKIYSNSNIPKIIFVKLSPYNYEYGTQKVNITIEGDDIKIQCLGRDALLEKFIETNSFIEESKIKLSMSKK